MTATIATVSSEFAKFAPALEADFVQYVTKGLERILEKYPTGPEQRKLSSSWGPDGAFYRAFGHRHLTVKAWREAAAAGEYVVRSARDAYDMVDVESVEKASKSYAKDQIAKFVMKLNRKLGELVNVEVDFADFNGYNCEIRGEAADGKKVRVEQNRILNFSKNGNPFHQWPARIYVDGKKVSEAAFKKMVGAAA